MSQRLGARTLLAALALTLACYALSLSAPAARAQLAWTDLSFRWLRQFTPAPKSVTPEVVIVGLDQASISASGKPLALMLDEFSALLGGLASGKPRAVGIDLVFPDHPYDGLQPGASRRLALAIARLRGESVLALGIAGAQASEAGSAAALYAAVAGADGSDVISKLATTVAGANQSLALLPTIVNLIQSASLASSAPSSTGGIFGAISGLFGAGSGGSIVNEIFHEGGIVGQPTTTRSAASSLIVNAPRYQTGGLVGRAADALRPREVAAILERDEEVLRRDDPRHRYNLANGVFEAIKAAAERSERETRNVLARMDLKPSLGAFRDLPGIEVRGNRELGGTVSAGSMYRVNERGPELLQVAGKQYLMMGNQSGKVQSAGDSKNQTVTQQTIHFNTGGQPIDRCTIDQVAIAASGGARRALSRNS